MLATSVLDAGWVNTHAEVFSAAANHHGRGRHGSRRA